MDHHWSWVGKIMPHSSSVIISGYVLGRKMAHGSSVAKCRVKNTMWPISVHMQDNGPCMCRVKNTTWPISVHMQGNGSCMSRIVLMAMSGEDGSHVRGRDMDLPTLHGQLKVSLLY